MRYHDVEVIKRLDLDQCPPGQRRKYWIHLISNGIGQPVYIPVIVARGIHDGPIVGLTAAIHGNELNGVSVIQKVFDLVDVNTLKGTLVGVPVLNVWSVNNQQRRFIDGTDLNRIMPGKMYGNRSEAYAYRIMDRIISQFQYLLDLHTASFGRVNSFYIRADMTKEKTAKMAYLQNPQIILNNPGHDGTLRAAASLIGVNAITVEVGDPNEFQKPMIRASISGILNVMTWLSMIERDMELPVAPPVFCAKSYWMYADKGGVMDVQPQVTEMITKGQVIAELKDIFGDLIKEYTAPEDGIVIGKGIHPINQTGGRIIHLGIVGEPPILPAEAENVTPG